jgi:hypothetical protein
MKLPSVRIPRVGRGKAEEPPGIVGVARVDPRTKVLVKRLNPGDIAVIDHADLDRVSADEQVAAGRPRRTQDAVRRRTEGDHQLVQSRQR